MATVFDTPTVRGLNDIIGRLMTLDEGHDNMNLNVPFEGLNEQENRVTYRIKASIEQKSKREILRDGFDIIKSRSHSTCTPIPINGRLVSPAPVMLNDSLEWLDQLIERWLGAKRKGLDIIWEVDNTIYRYDFYADKLYKED